MTNTPYSFVKLVARMTPYSFDSTDTLEDAVNTMNNLIATARQLQGKMEREARAAGLVMKAIEEGRTEDAERAGEGQAMR